MKKEYSLTIGIPAYNEEANIGFLLKEILSQDFGSLKLKKIIVSSDGSSDSTVGVVKKLRNKWITVLENKDRQGTAVRQNQIMKMANTDLLVMLNADVSLKDKKFVYKLCEPIKDGQADLTASSIVPVSTQSFLEKVLYVSLSLKEQVFSKVNGGINVHTCHGPARAFSKKLYKHIVFPKVVGEDAYSYFFAKANGYAYRPVIDAKCYYKLPANLVDHEKQSVRFEKSKIHMTEIFGKKVILGEYKMPKLRFLKILLKLFALHPITMFGYCLLNIYVTKLKINFYNKVSPTWEISSTSKILR